MGRTARLHDNVTPPTQLSHDDEATLEKFLVMFLRPHNLIEDDIKTGR